MANPNKGEVGFEAGGSSYKLSYSTNALCELEEALDMSVNEISRIMATPEKFRMKMARTVFWAGLLDHQPDLDIKGAGAILSHMKPLEVFSLINQGFQLAFPASDAGAKGASDARPPEVARPQAGNGEASSHPGKSLGLTPTTFGDARPAK